MPKKERKEAKKDRNEEIVKILIENSVSLQKVMTNTSIKLDALSNNISGLLRLFEMSARSFMDKMPIQDLEKDKEFLNKLNMLIDQNKTIAKGLTLMEEKIRERVYGGEEEKVPMMPSSPMMPSNQMMPARNPQAFEKPEFKKLPRF